MPVRPISRARRGAAPTEDRKNKMLKRKEFILGALAGLTLAAAATAGGVINWPGAHAEPQAVNRITPVPANGDAFTPPPGAPSSFATIFDQVSPAVVQIDVTVKVDQPQGGAVFTGLLQQQVQQIMLSNNIHWFLHLMLRFCLCPAIRRGRRRYCRLYAVFGHKKQYHHKAKRDQIHQLPPDILPGVIESACAYCQKRQQNKYSDKLPQSRANNFGQRTNQQYKN